MSKFKNNNIKHHLYHLTVIGNNNISKDKKTFIKYVPYFYNAIFLILSLIAIVPIIIAFVFSINSHDAYEFKTKELFKYFWFFYFIYAFLLLIDLCIRFFISDLIYYHLPIKKAYLCFFKKISNLYEILLILLIITLSLIFGKFEANTIWYKNNYSYIFQIITLFCFLNTLFVFSRFFANFKTQNRMNIIRNLISKRKKILITGFISLFIILLTFSFLIFEAEQFYYSHHSNVQGNKFNNMWESLWYCFITVTTIGYGDYVPISPVGKVFAVLLATIGISYYTFLVGILVSFYTEYNDEKKKLKEKNNISKKQEDFKNFKVLHDWIIKDLIDAGLIDKQKYNQLIKTEKPKYNLDLFNIDENTNTLNYNDQEIKSIVINSGYDVDQLNNKTLQASQKQDFQQIQDIIISCKSIYLRNILNPETTVIFWNNTFDINFVKNIYLIEKWPSKKIIAELELLTSFKIDKNLAWSKFGKVSNFNHQRTFNKYFDGVEEINVLIINKKIILNKFKDINDFSLNYSDDLNNVYFVQEQRLTK